MVANYERIFGQKLSIRSEGDHPELDCSELLNHEDTKIYQSLIGALWVVQLGRIDIITAVMTMSRFRAAPRQGHMDRVRRIHGFINKMSMRLSAYVLKTTPTSRNQVRLGEHMGAKEEVPDDAPHLLANE
jgi:hypothetical protein